MLDQLNLDGRVVVVTGGGTGLGREMALAMGAAGADIVVAGRRTAPIEAVANLVREAGQRSLALSADVTDSAQVENLFHLALDTFGQVDVLVNNAGMVGDLGGKPIWEITDDEWRVELDANLTSAFYCARAVAKHMVERGRGKIVNMSSGMGLRGGRDNYAYACSKGGVIQLTRTLATSLGRFGVTSNCIVPGYFPTEGTAAASERLPNPAFIPVGRLGEPTELGPVAVFLAAPASDYMNGQLFPIDGGALAGGFAPTGYAPAVGVGSKPGAEG